MLLKESEQWQRKNQSYPQIKTVAPSSMRKNAPTPKFQTGQVAPGPKSQETPPNSAHYLSKLRFGCLLCKRGIPHGHEETKKETLYNHGIFSTIRARIIQDQIKRLFFSSYKGSASWIRYRRLQTEQGDLHQPGRRNDPV